MHASYKKADTMQRFAGRINRKLSLRLCLQQSRTEDRLRVRNLQLLRTSLHTYIQLCILPYFQKLYCILGHIGVQPSMPAAEILFIGHVRLRSERAITIYDGHIQEQPGR